MSRWKDLILSSSPGKSLAALPLRVVFAVTAPSSAIVDIPSTLVLLVSTRSSFRAGTLVDFWFLNLHQHGYVKVVAVIIPCFY